eukprot:13865515-Ditylum_brightwellii.AAC.1
MGEFFSGMESEHVISNLTHNSNRYITDQQIHHKISSTPPRVWEEGHLQFPFVTCFEAAGEINAKYRPCFSKMCCNRRCVLLSIFSAKISITDSGSSSAGRMPSFVAAANRVSLTTL